MPKITKTAVDAMAPDPSRDTYLWDSALSGFGVRMTSSGKSSFILKYRTRAGAARKMVIARVGTITPDEARKEAIKALAEVAKGGDPSAARKAARKDMKLGELADSFVSAMKERWKENTYLNDLAERFAVQEVVIDRWNSTAVNTALQEEGFTVNQFGQGMASMSAPVKELKRAILSGQFRHGGSPLLRMCFGNVVGEKDAHENEKFTKAKARGRIDGAVAAAMAVGRIIANEVTPSPYEGRGLAFL